MGRSFSVPNSSGQYLQGAEGVDAIVVTLLGATANNIDPGGGRAVSRWKVGTAQNLSITGIAGGAEGRILILTNFGAFNVTLASQSGASVATNRMLFDGGNIVLAPGDCATLIYDGTLQRWLNSTALGAGGGGGGGPISTDSLTLTGPEFITGAAVIDDLLPSGDTDDFAPAGLATCRIIEIEGNADGSSALTGIVAQAAQVITLINVGDFDITLKSLDGGSAGANQFSLLGDVLVLPATAFTIYYSATIGKWVQL